MSRKEKYESEIRVPIPDVKQFLNKLASIKAEKTLEYLFHDHCYKPVGASAQDWDPARKIMRIRQWKYPTAYSQILYTKTQTVDLMGIQFKRTAYPQGKIELFRGPKRIAEQLLKDWNFEYWFTVIKSNCAMYKIFEPFPFTIALERINGIGYLLEIEIRGEGHVAVAKKICMALEKLGVPKDSVTSKSTPKLVAEKLGFA
jgi:adenylate cyclase class IV